MITTDAFDGWSSLKPRREDRFAAREALLCFDCKGILLYYRIAYA
jgi:hypothetical protein